MRFAVFLGLACLAACGGGTGRPGSVFVPFGVAGTVPVDGTVDVSPDTPVSVTFSLPANLATVDDTTVQLFDAAGGQVAADIEAQGFNAANLRIVPRAPLATGAHYRLVLSRLIQASGSLETLGFDREVCFVTASPTPTVRTDQILDLGNRLILPRFLAQVVRLPNGEILVFGGYVDRDTVADSVERWDPATRTFAQLPFRMVSPRAEHTATLRTDGRVMLIGGVAAVGGPPVRTTEIYDPATGEFTPGPDLNESRRSHGASVFEAGVMASGGFDAAGDPLDTIEVLVGGVWITRAERMGEPTAQHLQVSFDFGRVYMSASNFRATSTLFDAAENPATSAQIEPDIRFRPAGAIVEGTRLLQVGGDTRSIVVFDPDTGLATLASELLRDRRGAHSLTPRDGTGRRFLAAGGFQISNGGLALQSLEILDYLPGAAPDVTRHFVENVQLPAPFAGHVGFRDLTGATVLAGGFGGANEGDDPAVHSRRVVLILDAISTPSVACAD